MITPIVGFVSKSRERSECFPLPTDKLYIDDEFKKGCIILSESAIEFVITDTWTGSARWRSIPLKNSHTSVMQVEVRTGISENFSSAWNDYIDQNLTNARLRTQCNQIDLRLSVVCFKQVYSPLSFKAEHTEAATPGPPETVPSQFDCDHILVRYFINEIEAVYVAWPVEALELSDDLSFVRVTLKGDVELTLECYECTGFPESIAFRIRRATEQNHVDVAFMRGVSEVGDIKWTIPDMLQKEILKIEPEAIVTGEGPNAFIRMCYRTHSTGLNSIEAKLSMK